MKPKMIGHCELCGAEMWATDVGELHRRKNEKGKSEFSFQCFFMIDNPIGRQEK